MKAAVCPVYGPPDVLKITEVKKPILHSNELLIRIKATTVNSGDARIRSFNIKGLARLAMGFILGFSKPKKPILGLTLSGIVEDVGSQVTKFKVGDQVYASTGFRFGAHAQYIALPENSTISKKPKNATYEEAAAIIFGGLSALYFLQKAHIADKTHQKVLVYGATGSVGVAAIQIAKYYKAEVTAVCSEDGEPLARRLGCDNIILYDHEDICRLNTKYDIFFDAVGKTDKKSCSHLLLSRGIYLTVGGYEVAKETISHMLFLKYLYEIGALKPCIDKIFPFERIIDAHKYVDTGRKKANVVIQML